MALHTPLRVLIAGAGPAGAECALALRHLAGKRVAVTLIASEDALVFAPATVATPFTGDPVPRYPLDRIAAAAGAELIQDRLESVDLDARAARTASGRRLRFDILVAALGAKPVPAFDHGVTFSGAGEIDRMLDVVRSVGDGFVARLAFVLPGGPVWPIPLYELALLTAGRARDLGRAPRIHLVTPEPAPLAHFGPESSAAVSADLAAADIVVHLREEAGVPHEQYVTLSRAHAGLDVDRVVAMPRLIARMLPGIPAGQRGFLRVDIHGRVAGTVDIYAAGDMTEGPVKHGGLATQQADAVARAIAARAGADADIGWREPQLDGLLLEPHGARLLGPEPALAGSEAPAGHSGLWPAAKITGRYLAPCLAAIDA